MGFLSGLKMPSFSLPKFKLSDIGVPDVKTIGSNIIKNFSIDSIKIPSLDSLGIKIPDISTEKLGLPDFTSMDLSNLGFDKIGFKIPSFNLSDIIDVGQMFKGGDISAIAKKYAGGKLSSIVDNINVKSLLGEGLNLDPISKIFNDSPIKKALGGLNINLSSITSGLSEVLNFDGISKGIKEYLPDTDFTKQFNSMGLNGLTSSVKSEVNGIDFGLDFNLGNLGF